MHNPSNNKTTIIAINKTQIINTTKEKQNLSVIHWNCNGLASKTKQLEQFIYTQRPDIISLNELKCNEFTANLHLNKTGYYYVFKIRENNKGGGVEK